MWIVNKGIVSKGVAKAHLAQTAHSEKTANESCMAKNEMREEINQVLNILLDRLKNAKEDEVALEEDKCEAPEEEAVDSDFDDIENESSMPIHQNNCATPQTIPTSTRLNLARDSLTAPTPLFISNSPRHPLSNTSSSQHTRPDRQPLSHTSSSQHIRPDRPRSHRNFPVRHCPGIFQAAHLKKKGGRHQLLKST